jgi:hypothetical protein
MKQPLTIFLAFAISLTLASLAVWAATGFHFYTKFEVVKKVEVPVEPDDAFAQTGFYEKGTETKTVTAEEFHLGLLPTPQSLFDKHMLSVVSLVLPAWGVAGILTWLNRRRRRSIEHGKESTSGNVN